MLEPGRTVAGLRLQERLGEDQLAATWKVSEVANGRTRVLRLLTVQSRPFQERFLRAARAQLALEHPNLVQVVSTVEIDGMPGAVTEYVDGGNLLAWIGRPHEPAEIVGVFVGLLRGVGAAHAIGLLHRNLKPSKVLMATGSGAVVPKVNDFTLGKVTASEGQALTQVGVTFGTPQYMPPEQFRGVGDVDPRADLFALGCILFEMLTGRRPFEGKDLIEIYRAVSGARPSLVALRPDLPRGLARLVEALLEPDPAARPDGTKAVLAMMRADPEVAALMPVAARTPTLHPAGPTIVAKETPDLDATPAPAQPQPPPRPSEARTAELPTAPPKAHRAARPPKGTLPPEQVFVPEPGRPPLDPRERVLLRQIALASVVALALLALLATMLSLVT